MPDAGIILLLAVLLGASGFTIRAFERARADNRIRPRKQDWGGPWLHGRAVPAIAAAGAKATRKRKAARPQTVRTIIAAGVTDNWVAARKHRRENGHAPLRRRTFDRLVIPGRKAPSRPGNGHPPARSVPAPASDSPPAPPKLPPAPASPPATNPGDPMTTPNPGGGGAASDFLVAINRLIAEAKAGGLKSKTRVAGVFGEGFKMVGPAMDEYAKDLQDQGQYPPMVWEPVRQTAAMQTASGAKMTEHATTLQTIARTPMGEAGGKRLAPAKPELDKE